MSDTAPLRILEVETFGRGGLLHYAWNLSGSLAARGHEVTLLTADGFELQDHPVPKGLSLQTPLRRMSQRAGGHWPGPIAALGRKGEALLDAASAARLARRLAPDLVHLHNTNSSALAYLAAFKRLRIPVVTTVHQVTPHEAMTLQGPVYRRIHGYPDLLIAHSSVDRQRLADEFDIPHERVRVIPHGDYSFFDASDASVDRAAARVRFGLGADQPVALFFGYLREYKGLDLLLDAWKKVLAHTPGARLLVAGDPVRLPAERQAALRRQADALGVLHRFEYVPFDEVSSYFAAADLLVLPYRHISQSGVLYLALALGVPVVATAVGAWPEMLEDGADALLVPPEDIDALAGAIVRALNDAPLREKLASGGKALAAAHAWPAVAERTEAAFRDLLAVRPGR